VIGTGLGTNGDLIGNGFLPPNFVPRAAFGTVTMTGAGTIRIVGSLAAGTCTVTLTPQGASNQVNWTFRNAGGVCNRNRTGLGT
jgi:hypothetical protein